MVKFSLFGTAQHTLNIAALWRDRAEKAKLKFRTTKTSICIQYPAMERFPGPVQLLMTEELKLACLLNEDSEKPAPMGDIIQCGADCFFYRKYQLPCRHIWQLHILYNVITEHDWDRWAFMFEDGGFEIYESTTKEYVVKDIHEAIGGPDKHLLGVREVLDTIKERYYEICDNTADWEPEERNTMIGRWLDYLNTLTGPIRQQGVLQTMAELQNEEVDLSQEYAPRKRRRPRPNIDSEEEG